MGEGWGEEGEGGGEGGSRGSTAWIGDLLCNNCTVMIIFKTFYFYPFGLCPLCTVMSLCIQLLSTLHLPQ